MLPFGYLVVQQGRFSRLIVKPFFPQWRKGIEVMVEVPAQPVVGGVWNNMAMLVSMVHKGLI
ncbi:hypothetical protein A6767_19715 [Aeromonas veronii]|nr:hypothetical protein A6767_19715 [Aeromonas veronii]